MQCFAFGGGGLGCRSMVASVYLLKKGYLDLQKGEERAVLNSPKSAPFRFAQIGGDDDASLSGSEDSGDRLHLDEGSLSGSEAVWYDRLSRNSLQAQVPQQRRKVSVRRLREKRTAPHELHRQQTPEGCGYASSPQRNRKRPFGKDREQSTDRHQSSPVGSTPAYGPALDDLAEQRCRAVGREASDLVFTCRCSSSANEGAPTCLKCGLHKACALGDVAEVCRLIEAGVDPALPFLEGIGGEAAQHVLPGDEFGHPSKKSRRLNPIDGFGPLFMWREDLCASDPATLDPKVGQFKTWGATPLHCAVHSRRLEVARMLLQMPDCGVGLVNAQGMNAWHVAAQRGCHECVLELPTGCKDNRFVDAVDSSGFTPLHHAATFNQEEVVLMLWSKRCSVDAPDSNGLTALHHAARWGHSNIVARLVIAGSKVHALDRHGLSPAHRAAQCGCCNVLDTLLHAGFSVDSVAGKPVDGNMCVGLEGATPLHLAARFGHGQFIQRLVDAGASVHKLDARGYSALHYATVGGHMETYQQLRQKLGANPFYVAPDGVTVLHTAALGGNWAICKDLMAMGCDPAKASTSGLTPLHCAAVGDRIDVARGLIAAAPNLMNATDVAGNAPLHLSVAAGQEDMLEFFLMEGCDVETLTGGECTAAHIAAQTGCRHMLTRLRKWGASLVKTCSAGRTPLHYAALNRHEDTIKFLLNVDEVRKGKADVCAIQDKEGWTVLHTAAKFCSPSVVQLLLQAGADVNCQTKEGWTALCIAVMQGRSDVAAQILQFGGVGSTTDITGRTALHWAARQADERLFLMVFSESSSVSHEPDAQGYTPLHYAVEGGNEEIVDTLLDTGLYENQEPPEPRTTPLHVALQYGREYLLQRLIDHGYSALERNSAGQTAIHFAAQCLSLDPHSCLHPVVLHEQLRCVLAMEGKGVDVMQLDARGCSALHYAAGSQNEEVFNYLQGMGLDTNLQDNRGWSPLFWAAHAGRAPIVRLLLDAGVDVGARDSIGRSALHWAAAEGHTDVVNLLLHSMIEKHADVHMRDAENHSAVKLAARSGHLNIVLRILESTSSQPEKKTSALHLATQDDMEDVVEDLLLHPEISPNIQDAEGLTPLHWAASKGSLAIVEMILKAKKMVDVNKLTHDGWTALHEAAANGHTDVVETLVDANACVDIRTSSGSTALHSAAANGHFGIVECLLKKSKEAVNIRALTGATPLYMAASGGHLPAVVKLIDQGADLSIRTTTGTTPLHIAATNGHLDVVQHLLSVVAAKDLGAEVDLQAQNGSTALHQAALNGHTTIVEAFLNARCDTDIQNTNGCTALHLAASKGHLEVVECLLEHRADLHIKNSKGWTALHSAAMGGYFEVVVMLVKHGGHWKGRPDCDVVKLITRKEKKVAPSYVEGVLKLAETQRLRKEKAKGALQTKAEPSAEEIREKDRIANKNAEALLEELDREQKGLQMRKSKNKKKKKSKARRVEGESVVTEDAEDVKNEMRTSTVSDEDAHSSTNISPDIPLTSSEFDYADLLRREPRKKGGTSAGQPFNGAILADSVDLRLASDSYTSGVGITSFSERERNTECAAPLLVQESYATPVEDLPVAHRDVQGLARNVVSSKGSAGVGAHSMAMNEGDVEGTSLTSAEIQMDAEDAVENRVVDRQHRVAQAALSSVIKGSAESVAPDKVHTRRTRGQIEHFEVSARGARVPDSVPAESQRPSSSALMQASVQRKDVHVPVPPVKGSQSLERGRPHDVNPGVSGEKTISVPQQSPSCASNSPARTWRDISKGRQQEGACSVEDAGPGHRGYRNIGALSEPAMIGQAWGNPGLQALQGGMQAPMSHRSVPAHSGDRVSVGIPFRIAETPPLPPQPPLPAILPPSPPWPPRRPQPPLPSRPLLGVGPPVQGLERVHHVPANRGAGSQVCYAPLTLPVAVPPRHPTAYGSHVTPINGATGMSAALVTPQRRGGIVMQEIMPPPDVMPPGEVNQQAQLDALGFSVDHLAQAMGNVNLGALPFAQTNLQDVFPGDVAGPSRLPESLCADPGSSAPEGAPLLLAQTDKFDSQGMLPYANESEHPPVHLVDVSSLTQEIDDVRHAFSITKREAEVYAAFRHPSSLGGTPLPIIEFGEGECGWNGKLPGGGEKRSSMLDIVKDIWVKSGGGAPLGS
eukprot:jgi/Botrbrau1/23190/Bobra.0041s0037.2